MNLFALKRYHQILFISDSAATLKQTTDDMFTQLEL